MGTNAFSISNELVVTSYQGGIKLIKPTQQSHANTLEKILKSNFNVYLSDTESVLLCLNESSAMTIGVDSPMNGVGRNAHNFASKRCAAQLLDNDRQVMTMKQTQVFDEQYCNKDGEINSEYISFKLPWFDDLDTIIGTFGLAISLRYHAIASSLEQILNSGIVKYEGQTPYQYMSKQLLSHHTYLTKREIDIAGLVIKGQTAKSISQHLFISKRTVEHHLANIKHKFNVSSKEELIETLLGKF